MTWQQPYNNVIRTAIQALAGVLGGTQSLHTNSLDEAYALPSEHAVTLALRTQQVIAHESNVTAAADPLGGSYYVEWLTNQVEQQSWDYIRRIDAMGGMIPAIEQGFPQQEIANASYGYQAAVERGEQVIVGVNRFEAEREEAIHCCRLMRRRRTGSGEKLVELRHRRDNARVGACLEALRGAARDKRNTMPLLVEAVKAYATVGEIAGAFRDVFGGWTETSVL